MRPGDVETELRACLSRRAEVAPPPTDAIAEVAIRRARRLRRWRAGAATLAVALVTALGATVLAHPWPSRTADTSPMAAGDGVWPAQTPTAAANPTAAPMADDGPAPDAVETPHGVAVDRKLPVDVVVADQLVVAAGGLIDLAAVGTVTEAYRVRDGWLALSRTTSGEDSVWFLAVGSRPQPLITAVTGVVVDSSGQRLAWRDAGSVHMGLLARGRIKMLGTRSAPGGVLPVAFLDKGLLLVNRRAEEVAGWYAAWWLGEEEADLRWRSTNGVYGTLPDGRTVVAQVTGGQGRRGCLALLDARAELVVRALACDVPIATGGGGWLSPDGRWLVAEWTADRSIVVDLGLVFKFRSDAAVGYSPRPSGPGAWTDGQTVIYGGAGYVARLRVDLAAAGKPDAIEKIPVREGDRRDVLAVPRLDGH